MVLIEVFKRLWFDGDGGLNNSIFIRDLCEALPDVKSFSVTNLKYMKYFYQLYSDNGNRQQVVDDSEYDFIFRIPWGHHIAIINKCGDNRDKALFFIRETLENNWSRAVLLNSFLSRSIALFLRDNEINNKVHIQSSDLCVLYSAIYI